MENKFRENIISETCVSCGELTEVLSTEPVDNRMHYVEGAGQLCGPCFTKIYT